MHPGPLRIAVTYTGDPEDPRAWSGTPSQIVAGLRQRGVEVVPVSVLLGARLEALVRDLVAVTQLHRFQGHWRHRLHLARAVADLHPWRAAIRTRVARRRLRGSGVDGVVKIGSNYRVPTPFTVFDDMTVAQAEHLPDMQLSLLRRGRLRQRREEQARGYRDAVQPCFATAWAAQSAVTDYGIPRERTRVVGIGPGFVPTWAPRDWSRPVFLFIARQWAIKGGPELLAAFAEVRRTVPEARLLLVGGATESAQQPGVRDLGALDPSTPAGREALDDAWSTATCLVQPSRFEAAGKVFIEARHAGVPAIGSSVGGAGSLIGAAGCVVAPGDVASLREAMLAFADPGRAEAAGAVARESAGRSTWDHVVDGLLEGLVPPPRDGSTPAPSPMKGHDR